jgi:ATP adenylyltransferase
MECDEMDNEATQFCEGGKRPLWAPWRIKYILGMRHPNGCFLCDKAAGDDDVRDLVLVRGKHAFLLLNTFPYNSGHVMVVPYRHVPDISDLTEEEQTEMWSLIVRIKAIITKLMSPQGFNFGYNLGSAAGAGLAEHLHGHLVPRWDGDTNFMPVLSGNRVVPQALEETAAMLREAWLQAEAERSL